MDTKLLLQKLEQLQLESSRGFNTQREISSWANKVSPLLKQVSLVYLINFTLSADKFCSPLDEPTHSTNLNQMHNQLEMAIEELKIETNPDTAPQGQTYFTENSQLDVQDEISKIINRSKIKLFICDAYMDEKIFIELKNDSAPDVRLLTIKADELFIQRLNAAQKQFSLSKKIEARSNKNIHDRFYIIDDEEVWSLGTSYNTAGNKPTLLTPILSNDVKNKMITHLDQLWESAKTIKSQ